VEHGILCGGGPRGRQAGTERSQSLGYRDAGVVGDYNIMTGILEDVLVVYEVAPVRKEVAGGARVNT
jgi:hypothetical protein